MKNRAFVPAEVLLPQGCDFTKWSVVACDQYTSEPGYWEEVRRFTAGAPTTLDLILPEAYLSADDVGGRIEEIRAAMREVLEKSILRSAGRGYVYLERRLRSGKIRRGLVGAVDLEQYDYRKGSESPVRATEGTVLERIPPRVRVRRGAPLELPHIMVLIDDPGRTVIEPLGEKKAAFRGLYDFDLMEQSGHVSGWMVEDEAAETAGRALDALGDPAAFAEKYGVRGRSVLTYAIGDGNHSLATAKECFERLKKTMPEEQWRNHPARWALVELVNLHDEALEFEPIHRVLFGADADRLTAELKKFYRVTETAGKGQSFTVVSGGNERRLTVENPSSNLAVGTLQNFLDDYTARFGGKIDYIHGGEVVRKLSAEPGNVGFLLPAMEKSELFRTVILDGALPRKTFSMGHAWDKRFYLECRRIDRF